MHDGSNESTFGVHVTWLLRSYFGKQAQLNCMKHATSCQTYSTCTAEGMPANAVPAGQT